MLSCRITQLRKSVQMSQLQLAKELHLSTSAVGMYEQGRRTPSIEILVQLAKLFNVSLDYLITGCDHTAGVKKSNSPSNRSTCPCCKCCRH